MSEIPKSEEGTSNCSKTVKTIFKIITDTQILAKEKTEKQTIFESLMKVVQDRKPEPGETNEILNILLHFIQINQLNIFEMSYSYIEVKQSRPRNINKYIGDIIMEELIQKSS